MDVAEALAGGRYRLLSILGEGGMATVYRGYDTSLDIERAIKILSPAMAARPNIRRRFEEEARTMARLHHRSIVAVQDVGVDGDRVYMVMEILEGGSLMDLLERHGAPLPPVQSCDAVLAILAGLEVAHKRGVVHRDIKPHNVLVTAEGEMKVTDFGIAQVSDRGGSTRTGTAMGTWAYMAPEQRSSAKHVDARADVYAVGASLYVLLTMEEPYDLYAAEMQEELFAKLPGGLPEVLRKACRFRPDERYASASEMRQALLAVRAELVALGVDEGPALVAPTEPSAPVPTIVPFVATSDTTGAFARPTPPPRERTPAPDTMIVDDIAEELSAAPRSVPASGTVVVDAGAVPSVDARAPVPTTGTMVIGPGETLPRSALPTLLQRTGTMVDDGSADNVAPAPRLEAAVPASSGGAGRWLGIAAAALLLLGGGWAVLGGGGEAPAPEASAPAPSAPSAPDAPSASSAGSTAASGASSALPPASAPAPVAAAAPTPTPTPNPTKPPPQPSSGRQAGSAQAPPVAKTGAPAGAAKPGAPSAPKAPATVAAAPAPASAAPAPAAPAETGTVFINSQPFSQLSVDGRSVGATGWKGDLPVGAHAFTMTTADGKSKRFSLTVSKDAPARFCWDFTKDSACSR